MPYSEAAAKEIHSRFPEHIGRVGIHLNFTESKPINPKLVHSPFVNAEGDFVDFRARVSLISQLRHLRQLVREIDMQITRFHQLMGKYPSHIDSHGHTHCTLVMLLALLLSKQAGKIAAIRPTRQYDHEPPLMTGTKNRLRRIAKKLLNFGFRLRFRTVGYFSDIKSGDGGFLQDSDLAFIRARFDVVEFMCHPYYLDESEYQHLLSDNCVLKPGPGLELISYAEL
jgi:predicted glycoside hydrolase/deacetylase ChbG (UPF0249 family)